jgi:hypothetical protein
MTEAKTSNDFIDLQAQFELTAQQAQGLEATLKRRNTLLSGRDSSSGETQSLRNIIFKTNVGIENQIDELMKIKADLAERIRVQLLNEKKALEQISQGGLEVGIPSETLELRAKALQSALEFALQHNIDLEEKEDTKDELDDSPKKEIQTEITAAQIPDLLDRLGPITSIHEHKYDASITVAYQVAEINKIALSGTLTKEQVQLLADVETMKKYTRNDQYQNIYTPNELHGLLVALTDFSLKIRPDFGEVEGKVIDMVDSIKNNYKEEFSNRVRGVSDRARREKNSRRGMTWNTFNELASAAVGVMSEKTRGTELHRYYIDVKDPEPTKDHDKTPIYRFVAYDYAQSIVMWERDLIADKARQEGYKANCEIVDAWYSEVSELMDELEQNEYVGFAVKNIKEMIESMHNRLTGTYTTGFDKDFKMDPAGAMSLQRKIGHKVRELKLMLGKSKRGIRVIEEAEIVPLPA